MYLCTIVDTTYTFENYLIFCSLFHLTVSSVHHYRSIVIYCDVCFSMFVFLPRLSQFCMNLDSLAATPIGSAQRSQWDPTALCALSASFHCSLCALSASRVALTPSSLIKIIRLELAHCATISTSKWSKIPDNVIIIIFSFTVLKVPPQIELKIHNCIKYPGVVYQNDGFEVSTIR